MSDNIYAEWSNKKAWDGTTGHGPHCRAIEQNIRGVMQTGPCNCNHYLDDHGIQLDQSPSYGETFDSYKMKFARCNIPVTIKTGDQADGLRELVHGIRMAEKHLGVRV